MTDPIPTHGSTAGLRQPPGPDPMAPLGHTDATLHPSVLRLREHGDYRAIEPRHVTITTADGPTPGLLAGWRKPLQLPWEGLVTLALLVEGTWVTAQQWVPASQIMPA
ncbi:hypothetical protein [Nocardioides sp. Leaf307]|uniref:hypothetical protein n=1 Tax=Nocardioides sp. Leaf307 TaxID=1736331 RepID=UPI00070380C5|nr:hypothetical protein [Nocardioides sp. Leaf307]KQQ43701.1 hypothetical protein ASF50_07320 [Nocardioides sp. Leaf307]